MPIQGRRSDQCFKIAEEQSKSQDPLDQALAQINMIVGTINRRMEDLTSSDLQKNATESLEAYLNKVEGKEISDEQVRPQVVLEDAPNSSDGSGGNGNSPSLPPGRGDEDTPA